MEMKEGEMIPKESQKAEKKEYSPRVLLHFFRHGEKAKIPGKTNPEQLLTEEGKLQGYEKGKEGQPATPTAVGFGGYVKRAQEMSAFTMAGAKGIELTGKESLEEVKQKLDEGLKYGSKMAVDKNLGFYYEPEFCQPKDKAYKENRGLKFIVEESDALAEQLGDRYSSTYSRSAGRVATILQKYAGIAPKFDKIISDEEKKKEYGDVLERFMGSHAGVIDAFLCKVVEKVKNKEERDKLVQVLGESGFDPAEGFDIEIDTLADQKEPVVRLKYHKEDKDGHPIFDFNEVISPQLLQELVGEGKPEEPEDWGKQ